MKALRKSIIACGVSMLLCLGLLIGTTFAWFTDSITNSGNTITAGTLSIEAYAYDIGAGGMSMKMDGINGGNEFSFSTARKNLETDGAIINESLWEPGKSSAKLMQVRNAGTLAAKISLDFTTSGDLTEALWFDFVQVTPGAVGENGEASGTATVTGSLTERPMQELATFAENLELPLESGENVFFVLFYGMNEEAGNEYQGDSFTANVTVLATQYAYEEDGFGNPDYDNGALYPNQTMLVPESGETLTQVQLGAALNSGAEEIILGDDVTISENFNVYTDTTLNLNEKTITSTNTFYFGRNNSYGSAPVSVTIENGKYQIEGSNSGRIRFEDSCSATFRDVEFVGEGATRQAIQVYADNEEGTNTYIFENCTFTNAYVSFEGRSGSSYSYNVKFINCTFNVNALGNGGAAVMIDDYLYGTAIFEGCKFNVTSTGNAAAAILLDTYPDYIGNNQMKLTLNGVTITCTKQSGNGIVPVRYKSYIAGIEECVIIEELGECSYTVDSNAVDCFGNPKA